MEYWYVLHTKTHAEKRVAAELQRRHIRTYLPLLPGPPPGNKGARALFPGYLFAYLDLDSGNPAGWKWISGLRYLVTCGDIAVAVPDELIRAIERQIHTMQITGTEGEPPLKQGDIVRIKDGPFADLLAVFDEACTPGKRVQILLEVLNRPLRVKIEPYKLEKVSDSERVRIKRPRRTRGHGRPLRHP